MLPSLRLLVLLLLTAPIGAVGGLGRPAAVLLALAALLAAVAGTWRWRLTSPNGPITRTYSAPKA